MEGGSGSCKFGAAFVRYFFQLWNRIGSTIRQRLKPKVVLTDLSKEVLESRSEMAHFKTYISDGLLDFAVVEANHVVSTCSISLIHSKEVLESGSFTGPLLLLGNYFLDSLPTDAFTVRYKVGVIISQQCLISVSN